MFDQVSIIGCGLIGSSVLRRINKNKSVKKLVCYDNNKSVCEIIKKKNLSNNLATSPVEAVKNSDLILISIPLSSFENLINSIKDNLKPGSILMDTCSVKTSVDNIVKKLKIKNSTWIPGHPVAGTENSGPNAGFSDLFQDRWTILTPDKNVKDSEIKKATLFWESMGSKVKIMSVQDHDKIISLTSHLPHVIAYNIVKTVMSSDDKTKNDIVRYSAGGLRDFTRIAASDPIMWKDIFIDNSSLIIDAIDRFSESLSQFKKAIEEKNSEKLLQIFEKSKEFRKSIIKAGQDTDKPDFGRK